MRPGILPPLACLAALAGAGCDNLDVGRAPADEGAPVVQAIWVIDLSRPAMIDLLRRDPPAACSDRQPCPSSNLAQLPTVCAPTRDAGGQPLPGGQGLCQDPTAASNVMAGGSPPGAVEVRVVLSRLLDPGTVEAIDDGGAGGPAFRFLHPEALRLETVGGPPDGDPSLPSTALWDPGGAEQTSDPTVDPPGPALVLSPSVPLSLGGRYAVRFDPTPFADRDGNRLDATRIGPVDPAGYRFTVEGPRLYAASPDLLGSGAVGLAPNQVITLLANAPVVEAGLRAEWVGAPAGLRALAWVERGSDPAACAAGLLATQVVVFPVDDAGRPARWPAGVHRLALTIPVKDGGGAVVTLAAGGDLTVAGDDLGPERSEAIAYHVTPAQCLP